MILFSAGSDIATIAPAIVAVAAYGWYQIDLLMRPRRLEQFLKSERKSKRHKENLGRRTIRFLASQLRMTETEVLEAGSRSRKLICVPGLRQGNPPRHETGAGHPSSLVPSG